jgi:alkanesulfonate monooxygenase SsuD/methylene tetrahydromethanopterin reductase-like flavin-dependent oxidoreductase (luciferase family)
MATLGMKLDGIPTEEIVALAPEVEAAGLDELWVCEGLGRNGGIAQAALALAATRQIRVGLGILPAAVRNVAYMAMEIASLCRAHPGRFVPGIGHGMPSWLRQVDAHPGKLLPCLEEVTVVARRLVCAPGRAPTSLGPRQGPLPRTERVRSARSRTLVGSTVPKQLASALHIQCRGLAVHLVDRSGKRRSI